MSVTKRAIVFLLITFAVSWTAVISAFLRGHREMGDAAIALIINAFGPGFAALVCCITFEKGQRLQALGLRFRPNLWWLWALLISVGLIALMIVVTALFSPHKLVGFDDMARQLAAPKHEHYSDARAYLLQTSGAIAVTIIAYSIVFTLAEELGWRGYLYHLWRRFGFWRFSLSVGLIWGIWHWPSIYLFGLNYPDHRVLGLFLFPIYTALLATMETLVRDRGRSVWAAGIMHGTEDALAVLTLTMVDAPKFPWSAAGVGGVTAVAIGALLIALFQRRDAYRSTCTVPPAVSAP